jgi:hypothetical protein
MSDTLAKRREEAQAAIARLASFEVSTLEHEQGAVQLQRMVRDKVKEIDGERSGKKAPHLEAATAVDADYMPVIKLWKQVDAILGKKLSNAETKRLTAEREAREAAVAAAEAGNTAECSAALATVAASVETARPDGRVVTLGWECTLIDEALVPREFLTFDQRKADAYCKENKNCTTLSVPGLRFEWRAKVRSK